MSSPVPLSPGGSRLPRRNSFGFNATAPLSANKENATPTNYRRTVIFSPSTAASGSKLPMSSSSGKLQKWSKAASPEEATINSDKSFDSPIVDFSELVDKSKSIHTTATATTIEVSTQVSNIDPIDITRMQYDDLYLVANKQKKDLQTLREFSDLEKEIWHKEEETKRSQIRDEEKMKMEKAFQDKMEQREKLGNLEIQNINKELQVKTEVINEQLNVISMKDDKIAMQKLELEKAKEDIVEINQQKASLEVEKQLLESALVTLQDKLNAKTEERDNELESLKAMLSASRLESKQAAENLKLAKQSHLELLKQRSKEKSFSVMERAARDVAIIDRVDLL